MLPNEREAEMKKKMKLGSLNVEGGESEKPEKGPKRKWLFCTRSWESLGSR